MGHSSSFHSQKVAIKVKGEDGQIADMGEMLAILLEIEWPQPPLVRQVPRAPMTFEQVMGNPGTIFMEALGLLDDTALPELHGGFGVARHWYLSVDGYGEIEGTFMIESYSVRYGGRNVIPNKPEFVLKLVSVGGDLKFRKA